MGQSTRLGSVGRCRDPPTDYGQTGRAVDQQEAVLARPELFGLRAATDASRGHFPGLSDTALAVDQGAQDVLAVFDRLGFEAAAVTALSIAPGGAPPPLPDERRTLRIEVDFDRPFRRG
ncbi:hypothetical protein ACTD5D_28335 [Nocardia takedensis]|uniref:hypothetical protein n=1 Tax=Nocardia takedensis TaxID=259390 RepID=UPI003F75E4E0